MKKTLTVNLGGTVFNIDEDAYRLLDNYLSNLKLHFKREAGVDEIVDDIERRISELFAEKLTAGLQVITITDVEEVIARVGKPEDFDTDEAGSTSTDTEHNAESPNNDNTHAGHSFVHRRFFRNPDDKMLGGVVGGLAAYLEWDVTVLRLALVIIMIFGFKILVPAYIICWIIIPEARTAAEKLNMRGEAVTVENIGKTVTDGFDKMANGVHNYMKSEKPRSFLQKFGDAILSLIGWLLKICMVVVAIICSPLIFVFALAFIVLFLAAIALGIGGSAALISLFPMADIVLPASPLSAIVMYIAGILLVGIPVVSLVFGIFHQIFNWAPMATGLKWTLLALWVVCLVIFLITFSMHGFIPPEILIR